MKMTTLFPLQWFTKTKLLIIAVLFVLSFSAKAQECATPDVDIQEAANLPWFGNPDYLSSFMDSVRAVDGIPSQYSRTSRIVPDIKWRIPIKFWIFTQGNLNPDSLVDDGEDRGLPQELQLQRLIDDANNAFRNTEVPSGIQFYMKGSRQVVFHNTSPSAARILLFLGTGAGNSAFYDDKALNVYITTDGRSYFNGGLKEFIVLTRDRYSSRRLATSMAHELGHYFGLGHTHQFKNNPCFQEPVTRRPVGNPSCAIGFPFPIPFIPRCSYTGDFLCDTEADPDMSDHPNDLTSCTQYVNAVRDYLRTEYTPLLDNYMAYGNRNCRSTFTKGQVSVMWWFLKNTPRGRSGRWRIDLHGRQVDIFEPNNTISGALSTNRRGLGELGQDHILLPNVPQLHTFHKNIYGEMIDQEDWIPIGDVPNGVMDNYVITVESDIANFIEDIEVFNAGEDRGLSVERQLLSRLVSSSVPNQTRWEISIPCDSINNGNSLYLRVRRNQNLNEFGTYTVLAQSSNADIEISVDGDPKTICAGTTYLAKLENFTLTPNFTITWQDSISFDNGTNIPFSEIVAARNQIEANFSTSESSGVFVLQATITNNLTGCSETIERAFRIGTIPEANLQIITERRPPDVCPNMVFSLQMNLLRINGINYDQVEEIEWTSSNPAYTFITSPDEETVMVQAPSTSNRWTIIKLRVRNACGWTEREIEYTTLPVEDCNLPLGQDPTIGIYPNPTGGSITVDIICLCGIEPIDILNPTDLDIYSISRVDISDIFGTTRLSYEGKQIPINSDGKIHLNLSSLPAGNYILKLIMQEKVYMKHVIKQ